MEVPQENHIAFAQLENFYRSNKSGPKQLLGSRHKTACTKFAKTIGTRMFQASCSAALIPQVFMAGVPSVARPNMRFKPFASLTQDGLKPAP